MKKSMRNTLLLCCGGAIVAMLSACNPSTRESTPVTLNPAPPGPSDLGPPIGLSKPPADAIVFDLRYRPRTGNADDIEYLSFWGYGGSREEAKADRFIQDVARRHDQLRYEQIPSFEGRQWAAIEVGGGEATALYFDLNANGKLDDNERIPPTRRDGYGIEFITPDFMNSMEGGGEMLCRVLLQANHYPGSSGLNFMWSPAAVMDGTAPLDGVPARILLFAPSPGERFDTFGRAYYALLKGEKSKVTSGEYIQREKLSKLVASEGKFYHLAVEGHRSNGLPARVVLTKDTSPTGSLSVKLEGSNSVPAVLSSVYLKGLDDTNVFLHMASPKGAFTLPVGAYALSSGDLQYGSSDAWEVSFQQGPRGTVKAGEELQLALGQPVLKVRAVEEGSRYNQNPKESSAFKKGTKIYLEPRILGRGGERFGRFSQGGVGKPSRKDCPPKITITRADGTQALASTMEYG